MSSDPNDQLLLQIRGAVAFNAPEFPWLFGPEASHSEDNSAGRLRPWLCLVVVRREAAQIVTDPNQQE
jgi:hypothetical protein